MAFEDFERLTPEELRGRGASKWTTFPGAIGTFIAESDFGTAPAVVDAIRRRVDTMAFGYSTEYEKTQVGESLARWVGDRYDWDIEAAQVGVVPEVLSALEFTLDNLIAPGAPVFLPTPNYMPFFNLVPDHGHELIEVPMRPAIDDSGTTWNFDYDAIEAAFAGGAGLLMLINPANPTGTVYTREQLLPLVDIVDRHGGRVWADEVHAPIVYDGRQHIPYASLSDEAAAHTVTATSASKGWNIAGLKCAQLICTNPADATTFAHRGTWTSHATGYLGVFATIAAYDEGRDWLDELVAHLQKRRDQLTNLVEHHLPHARLIPAQGTYLGWLDLREYGVEGSLQTLLRRKAQVAGTDGRYCGKDFGGYFRINFATPGAVLEETIERIAGALQT